MPWTEPLPYFTRTELQCKCCQIIKIDIRFAAMLPALRREWAAPLYPNSACRCAKHNRSLNGGKGGHPTSLHLMENPKWPTVGSGAIDIQWRHWPTEKKLQFARMAHRHGFRVGLHDGFIHLDIGRLIGIGPRPFLYGEWSNAFPPEDLIV